MGDSIYVLRCVFKLIEGLVRYWSILGEEMVEMKRTECGFKDEI